MSFFERFIMRVFSLIMLVMSLFTFLVLMNIINVDWVEGGFAFLKSSLVIKKISVLVSGIIFLMALRGLLARLKPVDLAKNGIILENGNGKLVISKESLENLISSVSRDIPGTESISSKTILDKNRNLKVQVNIVASQDVYLKDLSLEVQKRVKDALLRTADLEAKEVDVRIKNISNKKAKKIEKVENKKENKKDNKKESNDVELKLPEEKETKEPKMLEEKNESKKEEGKK